MIERNAIIEIEPPSLERFEYGNAGVEYFHTFDSGVAGPNALVTSIVHGNEYCGAIAVAGLIDRPPSLLCGALTVGFVNIEAFSRFDPAHPWQTRYVDEDLNRVWDEAVLSGPGESMELSRARDIKPLVDQADYLLDLHSMMGDAQPLILAGPLEKGRRFAEKLSAGMDIVLDEGHRAGRRLRDHGPFSDPSDNRTSVLAECGQHWRQSSVDVAVNTLRAFLTALDMLEADPGHRPERPSRTIRISHVITAASDTFEFTHVYQGMETIPHAGTRIAMDGGDAIRTPYDNCVLIMPTHPVQCGHTAVRLGRFAGK